MSLSRFFLLLTKTTIAIGLAAAPVVAAPAGDNSLPASIDAPAVQPAADVGPAGQGWFTHTD